MGCTISNYRIKGTSSTIGGFYQQLSKLLCEILGSSAVSQLFYSLPLIHHGVSPSLNCPKG